MDIREKIKNLSQDELARFLKGVAGAHQNKADIDRTGLAFPLSFSQKRIWFQCQIDPLQNGYNIPLCFIVSLQRPLEIKELEKRLSQIIKDNEILRVTFQLKGEEVMQVVSPPFDLPIIFYDLREHSTKIQSDKIKEYIAIETARPFDLQQGALLRFAIFQIDTYKYVFLQVIHHLISDGWSHNLFFSDLARGNLEQKRPQYIDFVLWEKERFTLAYLQSLLAFWKDYLNKPIPRTELNYNKVITKSLDTSELLFPLDLSLVKKLENTSKIYQLTIHSILLSTFTLLIHIYTGNHDILIGLPYANRQKATFQQMLGVFINMIPFRFQLSENESILDFLKKVGKNLQEVFSHADLPFNILIENLQLPRYLGVEPLFQILFMYQNFPGAYQTPGIKIDPLDVSTKESQYDFSFIIDHVLDKMAVKLKWREHCFDEDYIRKFSADFMSLIAHVTESLDQPVSAVLSLYPKLSNSPKIKEEITPAVIDYVPARDIVEIELTRIWQNILNVDHIGIYDNFFDLGGHSLLGINLTIQIEKVFGIKLPIALLFEYQTIEKLAQFLRRNSPSIYERAIIPLKKGQSSGANIFFIHPSGGQILCYTDIVANIKNDHSIYGIQAPISSENAMQDHTNIEAIAKTYLEKLPVIHEDQIVFAGWSLGGLIAFEMAVQYSRKSAVFPIVVIIDQAFPDGIDAQIDNEEYIHRFINQVAQFKNIKIDLPQEQYKNLSFSELSKMLRAIFIEKSVISNDIDEEGFENYLHIQKMHDSALKKYQPPLYKGRVLLINASVTPEGWLKVAPLLNVEEIKGDHFTIMKPPLVSELAKIIERWTTQ